MNIRILWEVTQRPHRDWAKRVEILSLYMSLRPLFLEGWQQHLLWYKFPRPHQPVAMRQLAMAASEENPTTVSEAYGAIFLPKQKSRKQPLQRFKRWWWLLLQGSWPNSCGKKREVNRVVFVLGRNMFSRECHCNFLFWSWTLSQVSRG